MNCRFEFCILTIEFFMKGIILSGGTATRLFPLTTTTSKQLLPVYDRQMIFYPLNVLIKGGIKDILVIIAPEHSGHFINLLGAIFEKYDVHLEFRVQKVPRGLADAFIVGENFIDQDDVAMILGDNIFEDDFSDDIRNFKKGGKVFAKAVPDPERFGVVEFDKDNKALTIEEKPASPKSNFAVTGLYIYDNRVIQAAKEIKPSERGEIEITDVNNWFLDKGELEVAMVKGEWMDAGTFDALLDASNIVRDKELYKNFDPIINQAITEFNEEMKAIAKKKLI